MEIPLPMTAADSIGWALTSARVWAAAGERWQDENLASRLDAAQRALQKTQDDTVRAQPALVRQLARLAAVTVAGVARDRRLSHVRPTAGAAHAQELEERALGLLPTSESDQYRAAMRGATLSSNKAASATVGVRLRPAPAARREFAGTGRGNATEIRRHLHHRGARG